MIGAFLRLFLITISSVILVILAVFSVRMLGFQQSFAPPPHPWFQRSFWWVFTPTAEDLCQTADVNSLLPNPNWIVTVPVRRQEDVWILPCKQPLDLGQFLKRSSHRDWILEVQANDTWSLDELVATVVPFDKDKLFAVHTEAQKVSVFLRKKAPQWLYAADSASLLRLRLFESLWIETAIDFWPDFLVTSSDPHAAFQLDERGAAELQRRKKRILWNWDGNSAQEPAFPIQGIMTNRPSAAQQKFPQRL